MADYEFWRHRETGEVYAVVVENGRVEAGCGPLDEGALGDPVPEPDEALDEWLQEHVDEFELMGGAARDEE
jgi:hypothetical protein